MSQFPAIYHNVWLEMSFWETFSNFERQGPDISPTIFEFNFSCHKFAAIVGISVVEIGSGKWEFSKTDYDVVQFRDAFLAASNSR